MGIDDAVEEPPDVVPDAEVLGAELDAGGCGDDYDAAGGAAVQTDTSWDSEGLWSCRSLAQSAGEQENRLGRDDVLGGGDVGGDDAVVDADTVSLANGYIVPVPDVNTAVSCPDLPKKDVEVVVFAG